MTLVDTHTHPHMEGYALSQAEFRALARKAGVKQLICVGTNAADSRRAIEYAQGDMSWHASVGLHPHEASDYGAQADELARLATENAVVAIGECGLDYYYEHSPRVRQRQALIGQLELAQARDLPVIFHLRNGGGKAADAFSEFFEIWDEFKQEERVIRGVVHSFTASPAVLEGCLARNLYIGLNGIMTFTKDEAQLEAARQVPLKRLVLETDSPFLTPVPFRGTVNNSGHVRRVAEFLCELRGETFDVLSAATTKNAQELFRI